MATGRAGRGSGPPEHEHSAGGVVVRGDDVVLIVPRKRGPDGRRVTALPKGHADDRETMLEAATREVREETGIIAEPVEKLGDVEYDYQRKGRRIRKKVSFWLFEYRSGSTQDHDHEIERAFWVPLADAAASLTFPGERSMVERAASRRAEGR